MNSKNLCRGKGGEKRIFGGEDQLAMPHYRALSQGLGDLLSEDELWFMDPRRQGQYATGIKSEPVTHPTQGPEVRERITRC